MIQVGSWDPGEAHRKLLLNLSLLPVDRNKKKSTGREKTVWLDTVDGTNPVSHQSIGFQGFIHPNGGCERDF